MEKDITTSENALGGKVTEITPEITKEMKEAQNKADKIAIYSYNIQLDQSNSEIEKLEKAIKMKMPDREIQAIIAKNKLIMEQTQLEIEKLEKSLELNLPEREIYELIDKTRRTIADTERYKKIVEGRMK